MSRFHTYLPTCSGKVSAQIHADGFVHITIVLATTFERREIREKAQGNSLEIMKPALTTTKKILQETFSFFGIRLE